MGLNVDEEFDGPSDPVAEGEREVEFMVESIELAYVVSAMASFR